MIIIYGQLYSSKNSKQIFVNRASGKPFITKSKVSKNQESDLFNQLFLQQNIWTEMLKNADLPLKVEFEIFRKTKARFDYINIIQGLCDSMAQVGFLVDDSADYMIPSFQPYKIDKQQPRTIIRLL